VVRVNEPVSHADDVLPRPGGGLFEQLAVYLSRRRPEWWWGVFHLPEFWLACALGTAFVASAVQDAGRLMNRRPTPPEQPPRLRRLEDR